LFSFPHEPPMNGPEKKNLCTSKAAQKHSKGSDLLEEGYSYGCQSQMSRGIRSFVG
jgi:hypothetical protein